MRNVLAVGPTALTRRVSASLASAGSISVTSCSSRRALARLIRERDFQLAVAYWQTAGRKGIALLATRQFPVILISDPKHLAEAYRLAKTVEILLETPIQNQELTILIKALLQGEQIAKAPEPPRQQQPAAKARVAGR